MTIYIFTLDLPLIGKVEVNLKSYDLFVFTKRQFENYICGNVQIKKRNMKIPALLEFYDSKVRESFQSYADKNLGFSRNLNWKDNALVDGSYEFKLETGLSILCREPYTLKEKVKKISRTFLYHTEEAKYAILGGEFYSKVLFPILSVYAGTYGMYCIHGSFIHLRSGANIIISGLDGVGKSSMADMICSNSENELLADNIVLFDGNSALNLNLAMRLEQGTITNQKILYENKFIKEVLPTVKKYNKCKVNKIFLLLREAKESDVIILKKNVSYLYWQFFMNKAPEIGQANVMLAHWLYEYNLLHESLNNEMPITSIAIPNGMLEKGRKVILNELKIFD